MAIDLRLDQFSLLDDSVEKLRAKLQFNTEKLQAIIDSLEPTEPAPRPPPARPPPPLSVPVPETPGGFLDPDTPVRWHPQGWAEYRVGESWRRFPTGSPQHGDVAAWDSTTRAPVWQSTRSVIPFIEVTANYTTPHYGLVVRANGSSGAFAVTLCSPGSVIGQVQYVKKTDATANKITIVGPVDGLATVALTFPQQAIILHSTGTVWQRLGGFP